MKYELAMDADRLISYLSEVFPQSESHGFEIENLELGKISVSAKIRPEHLRPGGTVSGPTMFALADIASYMLVLSHIGEVALAVTTNLNINFLSKPDGDLVSEARILKLGKSLAVCDIEIFQREEMRLVAHATSTYSIPPKR